MASQEYLMDILSMLLKYHDKIRHSVEDGLKYKMRPRRKPRPRKRLDRDRTCRPLITFFQVSRKLAVLRQPEEATSAEASPTHGAAAVWLRVEIWALNADAAEAGHRCSALLPTREIAGQGIRVLGATERAPWIRIRGLRAAHLRSA